jgi:phage tail sheath protein FI
VTVSYTYPGVYIQELPSPVHAITGVATSIAAFVGYASSGIDNRAQAIFSFADFQRLFGGLASDSELSYAVQQFFLNGGSQAYVVRVPKDGAVAASVTFDALTFTALSSGAWANGNLLVDVDVQNLNLTAAPSGDPLAFNLTITDVAHQKTESFPNVTLTSSAMNYVATVVNDPDNGSQLAKVGVAGPPGGAPAVTGIVGGAVVAQTAGLALGGPSGSGTTPANPAAETTIASLNLTAGTYSVNWTVQLSGTAAAGDANNFGLYNGTNLVATSANAGAAGTYPQSQESVTIPANGATLAIKNINAGTAEAVYEASFTIPGLATTSYTNFGLNFGISSASPAAPQLPVTVTVFPKGSPIPQTASGLATQLQQAINAVLTVKMPGASVQCSTAQVGTAAWPPANFGIRVSATLPRLPYAIVTLSPPPSSSGLADASVLLGFGTPTVTNVAHYTLGAGGNVGQQTATAAGTDGNGLPTSQDLIGDPALFTGIYALQKVDLFNLLSIPDATRALPSSPTTLDPTVNPALIYGTAISFCDQRRAFLLVDPPPNIATVTGAVDWKSTGIGSTDANGAAYWPRVRVPDLLNKGNLRTFAPSGVVAGVYAATDGSLGVWKAPAGINATLNTVQGLTYQLTDPENGLLNPLGLNCLRTFPVYGSVVWGARTLAGADALASQWKYVPVRRMALYLEESLYRGLQWAVFEPNDEPLWSAIRLNVNSFMQTLFQKQAFQGKTPDEAYFVKCDSETTTQTDIDNGIVNVLVGFAPLQPAEFVVIQIEQLAGQS